MDQSEIWHIILIYLDEIHIQNSANSDAQILGTEGWVLSNLHIHFLCVQATYALHILHDVYYYILIICSKNQPNLTTFKY